MTYESVIFDFNGVLSHDTFYSNPQYRRLQNEYAGIYEFIQTQIFQTEIADHWMRNQMTATNINRYIAEKTSIDFETISDILRESVASMRIEQRLIEMVQRLRHTDVLVALVTDNMDVFSQITVPKHNLRQIFSVVVNSADYGIVKYDDQGRLFEIAHDQLNSKARYGQSLLIDDSVQARLIYEAKGGKTYPYTTYETFEVWATENLFV